VRILATEGETTAVSGVTPGEELVTDGFDKLQAGSKIVVRQPKAPAADAAQGAPAPAATPAATPPPARE